MNDNKLKELEAITDKIAENLNRIMTTAKASELESILKEINKDLEIQNNLRIQTGIDKNKSDDKQIEKIKKALEAQDIQLKSLGLVQENSLSNIDKIIDNINKQTTIIESRYHKQQIQDSLVQNEIHSKTQLNRAQPDVGSLFWFLGLKTLKSGAKNLGTALQSARNPWLVAIGTVLKGLIAGYEAGMEFVNDITSIVAKMADRMESIVSGTDEAVRSTLQSMGMVMDKTFGTENRVDKVTEGILDASKYMVQQLGVPFDPIKIAEFQKAYAELSKTTVGFNEADLATLGEMQLTLDLSAQESAKITNMFIELGGDVDIVSELFVNLLETASNAGVNARELIKDMSEHFESENLYRFRGGVQDLAKMMSYAKRIRIDLNGMLKLMDKVSNPTAAVDLAAQLSALDTAFLGLNPIDLFGAAMRDVDEFTNMLLRPIIEHIDKYYDATTGQLTQFGLNFSKAFLKLEGISDVFKSEKEFTDFLMKQGKEKMVREAIMNSRAAYAEWLNLTKEEQENIIGVIAAQYQKDSKGFKITTLGKYLDELTAEDMRKLMSSGLKGKTVQEKLEEAAKGTVSVQDQVKVNEMRMASMMYNINAINSVNEALMDNELREKLMFVSNTIMDVGLAIFEQEKFKQMEIMQMIGLTMQEAYLFGDLLQKSGDFFASGVLGLMYALPVLSFGMIDLDEDIDNTSKSKIIRKSHGGIITGKPFNLNHSKYQIVSRPSFSPQRISSNSNKLKSLLSMFTTNRSGAGILPISNAQKINIVVSGEIRNYVNNQYTGSISGEKILAVLDKHLSG